ncbi:helix-turn-helix transcriptional regulator [Pseudomonas mosselii]|uniref:helix-turn-helix transcriptional regulator n=1 Tax=Pseudomonas mosselii TaxID=78327 RepID=UPI000BB4B632|nr:DNA-binding protein [Pseudomonas mosselii]ATB64457.1 DNA-binding protein [Pseudomonas mosselii]MDH1100015.1 DNA-binding protein [Pseudomonas mosselii]MEB5935225.1 DNA-binding protein [Pseudomonas mosselii]UVN45414.1 DNA-binding protein [Pseudomonas mosselii]
MEYEFTLKYQLHDGVDVDALIELLGEAGCDDAVVGSGQPGRLALAFAREGKTARDAMHSALENVRQVLPEARLIEASPDLVGLTDVAALVGVSRQNMRKLMLTHHRTFPAPVHDGSLSLWHLADILAWMQERGTHAVAQALHELAVVAMQVNVARAQERVASGR